MMYTVKEVKDKKVWDQLTGSVLLQTWDWGTFQAKIGHKIIRLGVYKGKNLVGGTQVIYVKSHLRTHIYTPNGPILKDQKAYIMDARNLEPVTEAILSYLRSNKFSNGANFIRIDPLVIDSSDENSKIFEKLGFLKAATQIQPEHTIILDLTQSEAKIMEEMTKSARYDINRGTKEKITCTASSSQKDFDIFWKMFKDTFKRQHFVANSKEYYYQQLKTLSKNNGYYVHIAYDKNKNPVASALFAYDELSAYYLHAGRAVDGGTAAKYAPKVLLWNAIKKAKAKGRQSFNLFGIAKDDSNPNDPWNGLTQFKKSFGGTILHFTGAYDFPLTMNYWFIRILERTRRIWGFPYFLAKQILNGK